jgi:multidrug efflux pump subunit AcrA (membrane-fusion protein)
VGSAVLALPHLARLLSTSIPLEVVRQIHSDQWEHFGGLKLGSLANLLESLGLERNERLKLQERVVENTRRELAESERALAGLAFQAEESRAQMGRELQASRTRLERITLRAPVAGHVLDLKAQSGQVAGPDTTLLKLVPRADLQAEARVNNRDLAFVRPGQSARLSVLAYDPSTYGQFKATVVGVGRDALPLEGPGDKAHFPISLDPASQVLERQGRRFELQPGMAIEAQLQLNQVTLLQLIFSKLNRGMDAVRSLR